jgi:glutamine synthetase
MNKAAVCPTFPQPVFVAEAKEEFNAFSEAEADLEFFDAVIPDLCGTLRGKRFPIGEAQRLLAHGMPFSRSIYRLDARGDITDALGQGFSDGDPDGTAWPLRGTLSRVWAKGPPRAQMLMSLRDKNGEPDPGEPRAVLERVLERFTEIGCKIACNIDPLRGAFRVQFRPL